MNHIYIYYEYIHSLQGLLPFMQVLLFHFYVGCTLSSQATQDQASDTTITDLHLHRWNINDVGAGYNWLLDLNNSVGIPPVQNDGLHTYIAFCESRLSTLP